MTLTANVAVFAQDDEEGPEGPPGAPIDKYILLLAVIGIAFAFHTIKKTMKRRASLS